MKDNKYDFLNKLGELDDDEIEMISEEYPFADRHDKLKIARLCEEKLAMKKNMDFDSTDEMNEKTRRISKKSWYRSPALSIAVSFVIIAGIGIITMKGLSNKSNIGDSDSDSTIFSNEVRTTTPKESESVSTVTGKADSAETVTTAVISSMSVTAEETTTVSESVSTTAKKAETPLNPETESSNGNVSVNEESTVNNNNTPDTPSVMHGLLYSINLPSDANGSFTISFNAYRDGGFRSFASYEINCPDTTYFSKEVSGTGTEKVYVMLQNNSTQEGGIVIGEYTFDYTLGGYSVESEDIRKAFEDLGAFNNNSGVQDSFKESSIKEMKKVLDGIRTEITLNNGDSTRLDVAKQSVTLLNWSVGTTLTSDEITSVFNDYTSGWGKSDFQSFSTLYELVYNESVNIVNNGDSDILSQLGYSSSDFNYITLPLEPMETLKTLNPVVN